MSAAVERVERDATGPVHLAPCTIPDVSQRLVIVCRREAGPQRARCLPRLVARTLSRTPSLARRRSLSSPSELLKERPGLAEEDLFDHHKRGEERPRGGSRPDRPTENEEEEGEGRKRKGEGEGRRHTAGGRLGEKRREEKSETKGKVGRGPGEAGGERSQTVALHEGS